MSSAVCLDECPSAAYWRHRPGVSRIMSAPEVSNPVLVREVARRRSFAIISHPDAGKTTLTEKFLL